MNLKKFYFINQPTKYNIDASTVTITTDFKTDLWQRTYYGFRNDNAPAFLKKISEKYFSFYVKTDFESKEQYDQCGVVIYLNSDNWFKASIEYEDDSFQRLGSVVTNNGYSDWATTDISSDVKTMYYRLSRREDDFCIENSIDGINYTQMRIFHLFEGKEEISVGVYACSPKDSSFDAKFSNFKVKECVWEKE